MDFIKMDFARNKTRGIIDVTGSGIRKDNHGTFGIL